MRGFNILNKATEYIYDAKNKVLIATNTATTTASEFTKSNRIILPGYDYKYKDGDIILPYSYEQINKQTSVCIKTLVVFIGGCGDSIYQPLLNSVFAPYEKAYGHGINRRQDVSYSEHGVGNVPPLLKRWFKANQKIVLVGHSWGGNSAYKLALEHSNIPIELLVTLDPVSYSSQHIKPKNVKRWINSYVQYDVKSVVKDLFGNISTIKNGNPIALLGHPWEYREGADKNFIVNKNKNGTLNKISHANALAMFRNSGAENEVIKI